MGGVYRFYRLRHPVNRASHGEQRYGSIPRKLKRPSQSDHSERKVRSLTEMSVPNLLARDGKCRAVRSAKVRTNHLVNEPGARVTVRKRRVSKSRNVVAPGLPICDGLRQVVCFSSLSKQCIHPVDCARCSRSPKR